MGGGKMGKFVLLGVMGVVFFWAGVCGAGEMPAGYAAPKTSVGLEEIKSLEGRWAGTSEDHGQETKPAETEYRVTSGGTAVEEKDFSGTPHEMISVYHDVNGRLSMAHYCLLGNQPELELKDGATGKWSFEESAASAALLKGQMRMNRLVIEHPDKNTLVNTWTAYGADGKAMPPCVIKLKRA